MKSWARLVRIPAVFTVIAQVIAAFLLVHGTSQPLSRMFVVAVAAIALYWSGMIFNDLWDIDEDTRERPTRPLPSGEISIASARTAAWGSMITGIVLSTLSGFIPTGQSQNTVCPGIVGVSIALAVLLYDGPFKKTFLAPVVMGLCRTLCFLLGAAPLVIVKSMNPFAVATAFPESVFAAAIGMGVYIMGVTIISTRETKGGQGTPIAIGTAVMALGAICMAIAPSLEDLGVFANASLQRRFPVLIGFIAITVLVRGIRVAIRPDTPAIQNLVRSGILSLIPFSAAFALLAAGTGWGLIVFALVIPSLISARRVRVT